MSEPKYLKVYKDIKKMIVNQEYQIGEIIPSGEHLAKKYNVSRLTVKKAVDMLVSEGFLYSKRGYGTEVIKEIDKVNRFGPNDGLLNVLGEERVTSQIHTFSILLPSEEIQKKLQIKSDEYVYHIIRSRFIDENPYSIEDTYMPVETIPDLQIKHLKKSVYTYIKEELLLETRTTLFRLKGVISDERDKEILGIEIGNYMVETEKYAKLIDGTPFEYSKTRSVFEEFNFEIFLN